MNSFAMAVNNELTINTNLINKKVDEVLVVLALLLYFAVH